MINILLYQILTWENVNISYKNSKFKTSAPAWNKEFELPNGSYTISDIQDYFEYLLKKNIGKRLIILQ